MMTTESILAAFRLDIKALCDANPPSTNGRRIEIATAHARTQSQLDSFSRTNRYRIDVGSDTEDVPRACFARNRTNPFESG